MTTAVLNGITLPASIRWVDEFIWTPAVQTVSQTLSGSLVVEVASKLAGQPITLQSGADYGWITYTQAQNISALYANPGQVMSLSLNGNSYSVMFRHHESPALILDPVLYYDTKSGSDEFLVTIKLMSV